jgi:hypothetical protein
LFWAPSSAPSVSDEYPPILAALNSKEIVPFFCWPISIRKQAMANHNEEEKADLMPHPGSLASRAETLFEIIRAPLYSNTQQYSAILKSPFLPHSPFPFISQNTARNDQKHPNCTSKLNCNYGRCPPPVQVSVSLLTEDVTSHSALPLHLHCP